VWFSDSEFVKHKWNTKKVLVPGLVCGFICKGVGTCRIIENECPLKTTSIIFNYQDALRSFKTFLVIYT